MSKTTLSQGQQILNLVAQSGIERDRFQALLESGRFSVLLREFMEEDGSEPTGDTYMVTIDYDMPLADMIEVGSYDWVNDDITAKPFPPNKRESCKVELYVLHFGRDMTTKEVLAELDKRDLRFAELPELLALGAAHPDLQRKFPLVALGSEWRRRDGDVGVPSLCGYGDVRRLFLYWSGPQDGWDDLCRFVAVRK